MFPLLQCPDYHTLSFCSGHEHVFDCNLLAWESGTYDADRSLSTIVKPLSEHLSGTQWSRQLVTLDSTSVDTMSSLWGPFNYELRILDFRYPDDRQRGLTGYWTEQEENISKVLGTIRDTLTSFNRIGSMPPAVEELGYLGLAGGWVVSEDGAALREDSKKGVADKMSRKWAGILGWRDESGERKAWGEEGAETAQECLQSLISIPDGVGHRWHATKLEVLGDGSQRYAFSSSDDDES